MAGGQEKIRLAESGELDAQVDLGYQFELGIGCEINRVEALRFWKMAADQGHAIALSRIPGLMEKEPELFTKAQVDEAKQRAEKKGRPSYVDAIEAMLDAHNKVEQVDPLAPKILLVEDEEDIREIFAAALESAGFRILQAGDGQEGFEVVTANPDIKVVLCDFNMPRVNGFQFVNTLRKQRLIEAAKIIFVTAFSDAKHVRMGKQLAVNGWIVKPVDLKRLIEVVKKQCGLDEIEQKAS